MTGLRDDWKTVLEWHCFNETADEWLARAGDARHELLAALMETAGPAYDAAEDKRPGTVRCAEEEERQREARESGSKE